MYELVLKGFIAAYPLFVFTIFARQELLLFEMHICSSSALNMLSDILGLFCSNSFGVILIKLYRCVHGFKFNILSGLLRISL